MRQLEAKPPKIGKLLCSHGVDNYHTKSWSTQWVPAHAFQESMTSGKPAKLPQSKPDQQTEKVESFMILKQACSSEYQGAQGAFKDSMIH
jgi:hypothetical protein